MKKVTLILDALIKGKNNNKAVAMFVQKVGQCLKD